jgi:hypothetical protein
LQERGTALFFLIKFRFQKGKDDITRIRPGATVW